MTRERTSRRTTASKPSSSEIFAETCLRRWSHHAGEEKRCAIITGQRSRSTGGITVGSALVVRYTTKGRSGRKGLPCVLRITRRAR
jgi:hypothetical protein